tara:strand:- start:1081 stop:1557 length:477 start_codon:yes stop_codon:yes gene_type:complete
MLLSKTKFILIISIFFLSGCGFKIIDKSEINNFNIKKLELTGEKRINYKLKNSFIRSSKKNSENILILKIDTTKNKSIKEKNIKNEITKYEILITAEIKIKMIKSGKAFSTSIGVTGDYSNERNYSITIANEKSLIENLITSLTNKTTNFINQKINDI